MTFQFIATPKEGPVLLALPVMYKRKAVRLFAVGSSPPPPAARRSRPDSISSSPVASPRAVEAPSRRHHTPGLI
ncbi:hypothetical protein AAFF_G00389030 [Aldrovandia affinis]|uniref:Uncharacterized protein n=1 Tax=Aldrovandia affinis TaxID=143900 RepID=A0AAD7WL27_9TELE|nr:hypothetical protein AAFF_G00389030 [Aldrovandia affinis]